jgi:hypothetical protein
MPDKERELVERLLARTADGTIYWEPTAKEGEYATAFAGNTVVSVRRRSELEMSLPVVTAGTFELEPIYEYKLTVKRQDKGEILAIWGVGGGVTKRELAQLYEAARRSALGTDAALDAVLDALKPRG